MRSEVASDLSGFVEFLTRNSASIIMEALYSFAAEGDFLSPPSRCYMSPKLGNEVLGT